MPPKKKPTAQYGSAPNPDIQYSSLPESRSPNTLSQPVDQMQRAFREHQLRMRRVKDQLLATVAPTQSYRAPSQLAHGQLPAALRSHHGSLPSGPPSTTTAGAVRPSLQRRNATSDLKGKGKAPASKPSFI